jgi:ribosomal-protein-alanine N-acetyltransferase
MKLPGLDTAHLAVVHAMPEHAPLIAEFFRENDEHLKPWDPPRPEGLFTTAFWSVECERAIDDFRDGAVVRWLLFAKDDGTRVIGRINFTQIVRGPFQSCMLGYAIDHRCQGRGLMREALEATVGYAFDVLNLHRVQANYLPRNARSGRLLARLGFATEGLARNYLYIDGAWRDHVISARINPTFDARRMAG